MSSAQPVAEHVRPLPQSTHAFPALPHAEPDVPPRQVDPAQQPAHVALHDVSTHEPSLHTNELPHAVHASPALPHAAFSLPSTHVFPAQHPAHVSGPQGTLHAEASQVAVPVQVSHVPPTFPARVLSGAGQAEVVAAAARAVPGRARHHDRATVGRPLRLALFEEAAHEALGRLAREPLHSALRRVERARREPELAALERRAVRDHARRGGVGVREERSARPPLARRGLRGEERGLAVALPLRARAAVRVADRVLRRAPREIDEGLREAHVGAAPREKTVGRPLHRRLREILRDSAAVPSERVLAPALALRGDAPHRLAERVDRGLLDDLLGAARRRHQGDETYGQGGGETLASHAGTVADLRTPCRFRVVFGLHPTGPNPRGTPGSRGSLSSRTRW